MTNSNNNSNKKKFTNSELNIDVGALTNLLTDEIKNLDTMSFNQHKQIEQCEEVIKNLGQIFNKLKNTSIHLGKDMESNSELQGYLFDSLKQLTEDVKNLDTITSSNKRICEALAYIRTDVAEFFDGKNQEFRITRNNFNEVITKLSSINTNLEAIKTSVENILAKQAESSTAVSTVSTKTETSLATAQTSLNKVATNSENITNSLSSVNNLIAQNHKSDVIDKRLFCIALLVLVCLCAYSAGRSYSSSQELDSINNSVKTLDLQIQSIKSSLPTPTPAISPNKSDKKQK